MSKELPTQRPGGVTAHGAWEGALRAYTLTNRPEPKAETDPLIEVLLDHFPDREQVERCAQALYALPAFASNAATDLRQVAEAIRDRLYAGGFECVAVARALGLHPNGSPETLTQAARRMPSHGKDLHRKRVYKPLLSRAKKIHRLQVRAAAALGDLCPARTLLRKTRTQAPAPDYYSGHQLYRRLGSAWRQILAAAGVALVRGPRRARHRAEDAAVYALKAEVDRLKCAPKYGRPHRCAVRPQAA